MTDTTKTLTERLNALNQEWDLTAREFERTKDAFIDAMAHYTSEVSQIMVEIVADNRKPKDAAGEARTQTIVQGTWYSSGLVDILSRPPGLPVEIRDGGVWVVDGVPLGIPPILLRFDAVGQIDLGMGNATFIPVAGEVDRLKRLGGVIGRR